jgi:hypothetical protein
VSEQRVSPERRKVTRKSFDSSYGERTLSCGCVVRADSTYAGVCDVHSEARVWDPQAIEAKLARVTAERDALAREVRAWRAWHDNELEADELSANGRAIRSANEAAGLPREEPK